MKELVHVYHMYMWVRSATTKDQSKQVTTPSEQPVWRTGGIGKKHYCFRSYHMYKNVWDTAKDSADYYQSSRML